MPPLGAGDGRVTERYLHGVELLVFLFLFVPSLVLSLFASRLADASFTIVAVATVLRDLALLTLVWFFLWRSGEPLASIGWTSSHAWREALVGLALFIPTSVVVAFAESVLQRLGLSLPRHAPAALTPEHGAQSVLAVFLVIVVAVTEEAIFRGYILLRLRELTRSTWLSVILSAGLFAIGHGYEGAAGMIVVGILGILFACVYLWRGSLVAPMAMHFCQDFLAIALLPLLAHGR